MWQPVSHSSLVRLLLLRLPSARQQSPAGPQTPPQQSWPGPQAGPSGSRSVTQTPTWQVAKKVLRQGLPAVSGGRVVPSRTLLHWAEALVFQRQTALARILWIEGPVVTHDTVGRALGRAAKAIRAGDKLTAALTLIATLAEALEAGWLQQGRRLLPINHCGGPGSRAAHEGLEHTAAGGD
jgi:hypothetical protein